MGSILSGMGASKSTTSQAKVDPELRARSQATYDAAKMAASMGFQPNRAGTIAAFTDNQTAAMRNNLAAAQAFGLDTSGAGVNMPAAQNTAGISSYSTAPAFDAAYAATPQAYRDRYDRLMRLIAKGADGHTTQGSSVAWKGSPTSNSPASPATKNMTSIFGNIRL